MNKKRILSLSFVILCVNILMGLVTYSFYHELINFQFRITSNTSDEIKIYQTERLDSFSEETAVIFHGIKEKTPTTLGKEIPTKVNFIRIDFKENEKSISKITDFDIFKGENHQNAMDNIKDKIILNQCTMEVRENQFIIYASGNNPYILIELDHNLIDAVLNNNTRMLAMIICIVWLVTDFLLLSAYVYAKKNEFLKELYKNRRLIWNLSKNDFKTKYAGSFFGVVWAFVQPVVTILLYWFVFQVGLRSGDVGDVPFVLWLMCGLVPWFFFQEGITSVTNCFIEYSYLVKKVVFKIDILPIVKLLSALFVHVFFIVLMLSIFTVMGYIPTWIALQLLYFIICTIILILAIGFITSSVILFFRDLGQIVQIFLQIGVWMTPIMWNISMIPNELSWVTNLLKLNPMFYIVNGFRDSLINRVWIFQNIDSTINFWLITIALLSFGMYIFKRLKVHFSDVL